MDKIFSTRIDESVVYLIDSLARKLRMSKKRIIEEAVRTYAQKAEATSTNSVFSDSCGIWDRSENPEEIRSNVKHAFTASIKRHHT